MLLSLTPFLAGFLMTFLRYPLFLLFLQLRSMHIYADRIMRQYLYQSCVALDQNSNSVGSNCKVCSLQVIQLLSCGVQFFDQLLCYLICHHLCGYSKTGYMDRFWKDKNLVGPSASYRLQLLCGCCYDQVSYENKHPYDCASAYD